jgi:hypothetical protein
VRPLNKEQRSILERLYHNEALVAVLEKGMLTRNGRRTRGVVQVSNFRFMNNIPPSVPSYACLMDLRRRGYTAYEEERMIRRTVLTEKGKEEHQLHVVEVQSDA